MTAGITAVALFVAGGLGFCVGVVMCLLGIL